MKVENVIKNHVKYEIDSNLRNALENGIRLSKIEGLIQGN